ncbi:hypothetical protein [Streptomyces sp. SID3212]|uniref:hypothetical protein n=1 Tax=Streptomyces sp. SID3212 TaxID=2690259 RepID=UPI00136ACEEF|nr:hypothetical protein [Streptomyces sp. SID3212]MYV51852.1 hypothetical protein [Streptomyces sp. SID3212]
MTTSATGAGSSNGSAVLAVQPRRVFNADQLSASFGGAGGGIGLVAVGSHMDPDGVWSDVFLYLAPVVAIAFTVLMSWLFAKLEQREIRSQNEKAIATVQLEISDPETSPERKEELRGMLKMLRDERIAYRL